MEFGAGVRSLAPHFFSCDFALDESLALGWKFGAELEFGTGVT